MELKPSRNNWGHMSENLKLELETTFGLPLKLNGPLSWLEAQRFLLNEVVLSEMTLVTPDIQLQSGVINEKLAEVLRIIDPLDPMCFELEYGDKPEINYVGLQDKTKYLEWVLNEYASLIASGKARLNKVKELRELGVTFTPTGNPLTQTAPYCLADFWLKHLWSDLEIQQETRAFLSSVAAVPIHEDSTSDRTGPPPPSSQPYGGSDAGAELLVRDWMRHLGILDAEVTRLSADGGIDVESSAYVAQVKNYRDSVGAPAIRELLGVATAHAKKPLFFTSGSYTRDAIDFANKVSMELFTYDSAAGSLTCVNEPARQHRLALKTTHPDEGFRSTLSVNAFITWATTVEATRILKSLYRIPHDATVRIESMLLETAFIRDALGIDPTTNTLALSASANSAAIQTQVRSFIELTDELKTLVDGYTPFDIEVLD